MFVKANLTNSFPRVLYERLCSHASVADLSVSDASHSLTDFSLVVRHSLKPVGAFSATTESKFEYYCANRALI
jgi:hypothetical protein